MPNILRFVAFTFSALFVAEFAFSQEDTSPANAAETQFSQSIATLNQGYKEAVERADNKYEKLFLQHRATLITALERAKTASTKADDLDEAIRLRDRIAEVSKVEPNIPSFGESANKAENSQHAARPDIPKKAVKFEGHSYIVVDDPAVYRIAANAARLAGGYLARINTPSERELINKLISRGKNGAYYIDGLDDIQDGQWLFADGRPVTEIIWDAKNKQPNNREGECVLAISKSTGKVHDYHTTLPIGYVIEWDE